MHNPVRVWKSFIKLVAYRRQGYFLVNSNLLVCANTDIFEKFCVYRSEKGRLFKRVKKIFNRKATANPSAILNHLIEILN